MLFICVLILLRLNATEITTFYNDTLFNVDGDCDEISWHIHCTNYTSLAFEYIFAKESIVYFYGNNVIDADHRIENDDGLLAIRCIRWNDDGCHCTLHCTLEYDFHYGNNIIMVIAIVFGTLFIFTILVLFIGCCCCLLCCIYILGCCCGGIYCCASCVKIIYDVGIVSYHSYKSDGAIHCIKTAIKTLDITIRRNIVIFTIELRKMCIDMDFEPVE